MFLLVLDLIQDLAQALATACERHATQQKATFPNFVPVRFSNEFFQSCFDISTEARKHPLDQKINFLHLFLKIVQLFNSFHIFRSECHCPPWTNTLWAYPCPYGATSSPTSRSPLIITINKILIILNTCKNSHLSGLLPGVHPHALGVAKRLPALCVPACRP